MEQSSNRPTLISPPTKRLKRGLFAAAVICLAILIGIIAVLAAKWPFTRRRVIAQLEFESGTKVEVTNFQSSYLPPGCSGERLTFRGEKEGRPLLMTVQKLTVRSSIAGLLTQHVPLINANGVVLVLPPLGSKVALLPQHPSKALVDKIVMTNVTLQITHHEATKPPVNFAIRDLTLEHPGGGRVMLFHTALRIPRPPGDVMVIGHFGPWRADGPEQTPVSGSYSFRHADLSVFHGIAGMLASDGNFEGVLKSLQVTGATEIPDFDVTRSGHKVHLTVQFQARVNATNGDLVLENVNANFARTMISSRGKIERDSRKHGRSTSLDLAIQQGRIEDVLPLFIKAPESPMTGIADLTAKTTIPPGHIPFLRKVEMEGDFSIVEGNFTGPNTQASIDKLSERARGEKDREHPENVRSDLKGHFVLNNGVAHFSDLSFRVAGARARLHGTYDLINKRIDLHGTLLMEATLSQATSGVKSFLIKAISPFLKKNRHGGAKFPVSITGTYAHPTYKSDPI